MGKCWTQLDHGAGTIRTERIAHPNVSFRGTGDDGPSRGCDECVESSHIPEVEHPADQLTIWTAGERECHADRAAIDSGEVLIMEKLTALTRRRTVLFILMFASTYIAQDRQTPFTLSVNTRLVVQTVSVKDKDGNPIRRAATKDDFILTEDGVPQTLSVFEFQKLDDNILPATSPISPNRVPAPPPVQNSIAFGPPGDNRYQDRRLLALHST